MGCSHSHGSSRPPWAGSLSLGVSEEEICAIPARGTLPEAGAGWELPGAARLSLLARRERAQVLPEQPRSGYSAPERS